MKLRLLLLLAAAECLASSALAQLTAGDVSRIIEQAITRALVISPNSVIAVTDREGDVIVLAVVPRAIIGTLLKAAIRLRIAPEIERQASISTSTANKAT